MLFFGLCLVLLWLVRLGSCASFEFVALGIMPMQVTPNKHLYARGNHDKKPKGTKNAVRLTFQTVLDSATCSLKTDHACLHLWHLLLAVQLQI